ncbi:phosphatidylglycerophosphate synthase [Cryobacterium sp. CAN_C3]|uniref:CDP-alcohol phosphatidyltransferase family protein n=1 Tax=unclassified Cryobacterium TaxID=2649013 RepID=UPI0018C9EA24|nr:CDP-alcohol phosphatidyltransferase family protein [Cryobacterium sp. CAN_C3]MEC5155582.1 phosphatidylglycerophosphate synthase [Cryobacterium sp. CAN_C3]
MIRVQFVPIFIAVGGAIVVSLLGAAATRSFPLWIAAVGWLAALSYLMASNIALVRGLRKRRVTRFGQANVVTAARSSLVGVISGIVVASFFAPIPVWIVLALVVPALLLDAVDGWVARRTNSASELGARFDMEVDAFLLLVLSAYVSQTLGIWVLAIGLMRYAFVVAGWIFPWLRRQLPSRYWRKVVTAVQGIALTVAITGLLPAVDAVFVAIALALLVESFGRDVVWLVARRAEDSRRPPGAQRESRADGEHRNGDAFDQERLWTKGDAPRHGDTT